MVTLGKFGAAASLSPALASSLLPVEDPMENGKVLRGRFGVGLVDEAWRSLPRAAFVAAADKIPAGIAVFAPGAVLEYANPYFVETAFSAHATPSDHKITLHPYLMSPGDRLPLTEQTCPICVFLRTRRPAGAAVGHVLFGWQVKWRYLFVEPRREGGLIVLSLNAGRSYLGCISCRGIVCRREAACPPPPDCRSVEEEYEHG